MSATSQYGTQHYVKQGGNDVVFGAGASLTHLGQEIPMGATITVGAENTGAGTINVVIQLLSKTGADLANHGTVHFYLSADANGNALATASSGTVVIGTDGLLIPWTAKLAGLLVSEVDGDIDITITEASTLTQYLVLILPTGARVISSAVTFV